jgi:hypothetical protein
MKQIMDTVEGETWEHMQDDLISWLPELKVHCMNDMACVDMFLFLSITSVQGFTCWMQYYFLKSGLDAVYLMQWRSHGQSTYPKMVTDCGVQNQIRSDNAPKFKGNIGWRIFGIIKSSQHLQKHTIQTRIPMNIEEVLLMQL